MPATIDAPTIRTCRWELSRSETLSVLRALQAAPLAVTVDGEFTRYWISLAGLGEGYNVTRERPDVEVETYFVDADLGRCSCPWGQRQPRGKPCRHRAMCNAALASINLLSKESS
jgi:hypothetical protein